MRFTSGIMTGIVLGAAASVVASPMMSRKTKRRIAKTSRRMMNSANKTIFDFVDMVR